MADLSKKVAIVGSGSVGRSWALLFSGAGFKVHLYDTDPVQLSNVVDDLRSQLENLASLGLSRGNLDPEKQLNNISTTEEFATCIQDANIIMECVPEDLNLKKEILGKADHIMGSDVILASSTSSLLPSVLSSDLVHRSQFLVMHPVNPPFYARAVELVPAPWTSAEVMLQSRDLMASLGQVPIVMKKEIEGFVLNRMQFALMGECWRLLKEGVVGVDGINKAVWSGLGPRYAFLGPFEVGHLNAAGIENYLQRYGPMLLRLQSSMGAAGRMGGELAERVQQELEKHTPLSDLSQRRRWRETRMTHLAKLKRDLDLLERREVEEGKAVPLPSDC